MREDADLLRREWKGGRGVGRAGRHFRGTKNRTWARPSVTAGCSSLKQVPRKNHGRRRKGNELCVDTVA